MLTANLKASAQHARDDERYRVGHENTQREAGHIEVHWPQPTLENELMPINSSPRWQKN